MAMSTESCGKEGRDNKIFPRVSDAADRVHRSFALPCLGVRSIDGIRETERLICKAG